MTIDQFKQDLFKTTTDSFEEKALWLFRYQATFNTLYKDFVTYLGINPEKFDRVSKIPFLPIELFKNHEIKTGAGKKN